MKEHFFRQISKSIPPNASLRTTVELRDIVSGVRGASRFLFDGIKPFNDRSQFFISVKHFKISAISRDEASGRELFFNQFYLSASNLTSLHKNEKPSHQRLVRMESNWQQDCWPQRIIQETINHDQVVILDKLLSLSDGGREVIRRPFHWTGEVGIVAKLLRKAFGYRESDVEVMKIDLCGEILCGGDSALLWAW